MVDFVFERLSTTLHPSLMRCTLDKRYVGYGGSTKANVSDEMLKLAARVDAERVMKKEGGL